MKNNIFVISTILLGVVRNQAIQTSEMDRYYNNVIARGMNADDPAYKALDGRK